MTTAPFFEPRRFLRSSFQKNLFPRVPPSFHPSSCYLHSPLSSPRSGRKGPSFRVARIIFSRFALWVGSVGSVATVAAKRNERTGYTFASFLLRNGNIIFSTLSFLFFQSFRHIEFHSSDKGSIVNYGLYRIRPLESFEHEFKILTRTNL